MDNKKDRHSGFQVKAAEVLAEYADNHTVADTILTFEGNHIMDVNAVSSATNPYSKGLSTNFKQSVDDFSALANALDAGNITDAQSAFSSFQKDIQSTKGLNSLFSSNSQIGKDYQSLQDAFKSGDITSVQDAFKTLQKDLSSVQGHKPHHHHHHQPKTSQTDAAAGTSATNPATTSTPQVNGTNVNSLI